MREYWAIGLMTGTALDGFVDVALLKTDGHKIIELGPYALVPYGEKERKILFDAVHDALKWQFIGAPPISFIVATNVITEIYANAIDILISKTTLKREQIDFIGAHGLTVLHHPPKSSQIGQTLQLLDGQKLADLVKISVVYDFRTNDMKHGGQGAPLAPIYHAALLKYAKIDTPAAILNLGGVANLTYLGEDGFLAAFDCGPANGPINELVEMHGKGTYDKDGHFAASGNVDYGLLNEIISNPWFYKSFPKSLDRYDFGANIVKGLSLEDGCATLSALVGMAVAKGLKLFPQNIKTLVVAGGGRKNPQMMRDIIKYSGVETTDSDTIGIRGDAVEAECFAFLAIRRALNLPISFQATTGVLNEISGGEIANFNQTIL